MLPFFFLYAGDWLKHKTQGSSDKEAYYEIAFEQEAYEHACDPDYLEIRQPYAWLEYL